LLAGYAGYGNQTGPDTFAAIRMEKSAKFLRFSCFDMFGPTISCPPF